ncbi:MAG: AAA family ATPase [Cyanobacteria bacterium P01_D01_bin.44]
MASKIAFANLKGGTGKTTLCINVAAQLALHNSKKVLVVDFDPQANATSGLGIDSQSLTHSIYDAVLTQCEGYDGVPITQIILETEIENLHLAPSELDFSAAALVMQGAKDRAGILARILEPVQQFYDYILIDLPSDIGLFTLNGLYAADRIVVPIDLSIFALEGFENLKIYCSDLEKKLGKAGAQFTIVLNRSVKPRVSAKKAKTPSPSQEIETAIKAMSYPLFTVPDSVIVYRAQQAGVPVAKFSPKSGLDNAFGAIANYLALSH